MILGADVFFFCSVAAALYGRYSIPVMSLLFECYLFFSIQLLRLNFYHCFLFSSLNIIPLFRIYVYMNGKKNDKVLCTVQHISHLKMLQYIDEHLFLFFSSCFITIISILVPCFLLSPGDQIPSHINVAIDFFFLSSFFFYYDFFSTALFLSHCNIDFYFKVSEYNCFIRV